MQPFLSIVALVSSERADYDQTPSLSYVNHDYLSTSSSVTSGQTVCSSATRQPATSTSAAPSTGLNSLLTNYGNASSSEEEGEIKSPANNAGKPSPDKRKGRQLPTITCNATFICMCMDYSSVPLRLCLTKRLTRNLHLGKQLLIL